MLNLFLLGLATWRLSHLLVEEAGPWDVALKIRHKAGIRFDEWSAPYAETMVGNMLLCIYCTSIWVGFGLALTYLFLPPLVWQVPAWTCALSALAIAIQRGADNNFRFWEDPA